MDSREALDLLLTEVNAAVEGSLARYSAATQGGDLDSMEVEQERQRNLLNVRNQLQVMQDLWPKLVGKRKPARKAKTARKPRGRRKRAKRGETTPQQAYVIPILQALDEMGGRGSVAKVVDRVGELMSGTLGGVDFQQVPSRKQIRWRNSAAWARQKMKEDGLLADNSTPGTWEMTDRGRVYLHDHAEEPAKLKVQPRTGRSERTSIPDGGLPIFALYEGRRYEGTLFANHHVRLGDHEYGSPSGAGVTIVPYDTLNGWRFWRYMDDQGKEHRIDDLRG